MSTHTNHTELNQVYFCTITCHRWFPLFEEAQAYEEVYNWFRHLQADGCQVLGYVIMPNHLHLLVFPTQEGRSLNRLISEGKRFMAYGIVKRLKQMNHIETLNLLSDGVQEGERKKGKQHQVFRLSFDAKLCKGEKMLKQKLDYIHHNPVSGKWQLAEDFVGYRPSSARYYELGEDDEYVTHYKEMKVNEEV